MNKWHLALMGMGGVLGIVTIVWLGFGGIGYSIATSHPISGERQDGEKAYDNKDQPVMDANTYFTERARAIEAGFKAAFLFHK